MSRYSAQLSWNWHETLDMHWLIGLEGLWTWPYLSQIVLNQNTALCHVEINPPFLPTWPDTSPRLLHLRSWSSDQSLSRPTIVPLWCPHFTSSHLNTITFAVRECKIQILPMSVKSQDVKHKGAEKLAECCTTHFDRENKMQHNNTEDSWWMVFTSPLLATLQRTRLEHYLIDKLTDSTFIRQFRKI